MSRPSLWTDLDCVDTDKTLTYLERSKSSPINLSLCRDDDLPPPHDSFLQIVPHVVGRLKSLTVWGTQENLQDITARLSHPTPLLEKISISASGYLSEDHPVLAPAFFGKDLTSLRELSLWHIWAEVPWRRMVNLVLLKLTYTLPISTRRLLDFFESTPHLRIVNLSISTPVEDAQNGRLVSPACLERMVVYFDPLSALLDHLLIPVGVVLIVHMDLESLPDEDPPTFLGNLRNLRCFNKILLYPDEEDPSIHLEGPNGDFCMIPTSSLDHWTCPMLKCLVHFDVSKAERLEISYGHTPSSGSFRAVLRSLKHLRFIKLYHCESPHTFIHALHPSTSSSGVKVCPKLEGMEFVQFVQYDNRLVKNIVGMAAARASRGVKLKSVTLTHYCGDQHPQLDLVELEKHVLHVECNPQGQW